MTRVRKRRKYPRRHWLSEELARAVFMLGEGYTPTEAAKATGGTNGAKLAARARSLGIRFPERNLRERHVRGVVSSKDKAALAAMADQRGLNLDTVVGRLLSALAAEPAIAANLLDESA